MLGFVGYQLWGTGIETARAQRDLATTFESQMVVTSSEAPTTTISSTSTTAADSADDNTTTSVAVTTTVPPAPTVDIALGDPIARLEIPAIDVDQYVVAGVGVEELRLGPGHFPDTPLPGQLGNAAIAGHRTTYGQPFHDVDQLKPGDQIIATTISGRFVYRVRETLIVEPSDYHVVATTDPSVSELTLTSCHPKWSAAQRIIIHADLDMALSNAPTAASGYRTDAVPASAPSSSVTIPDEPIESSVAAETTTTTSSTVPTGPIAGGTSVGTTDAFAAGWFHDSTALVQTVLWAIPMTALVALVRWWSRRRRSWFPALPLAAAPGFVMLYFLYENINGLLPPNL